MRRRSVCTSWESIINHSLPIPLSIQTPDCRLCATELAVSKATVITTAALAYLWRSGKLDKKKGDYIRYGVNDCV